MVAYQEAMKKIKSNYVPKEDSEKNEEAKKAKGASKGKEWMLMLMEPPN